MPAITILLTLHADINICSCRHKVESPNRTFESIQMSVP
jgi:hypothetical protein